MQRGVAESWGVVALRGVAATLMMDQCQSSVVVPWVSTLSIKLARAVTGTTTRVWRPGKCEPPHAMSNIPRVEMDASTLENLESLHSSSSPAHFLALHREIFFSG